MLAAFTLAVAVVTPPPPPRPRLTIVARARIIRAARISLRDPAGKPVEAMLRKGLIEFP